MNETKKGFIQLHLSVLLAGFTGLFGRLITLNEVDIVWYRMLFTIMIGVVSSAVCALYAICNKKASVGVRSRTVLMYQMSGGLIVVSVIIPVYLAVFPSQQPVIVIPEGSNLWYMLCHALFCTVGMYLLQIQALKRLSAFTVNLTYNLEPCYTIILAFLIFGEGREINFSFYLGIALILLSVLLQSIKALHSIPSQRI